MNMVTPDELHRLVKIAMDTGEAESVEHAQRIFAGYRIGIAVGPEIRKSRSHQAALLTLLRLAKRVFLGGIDIVIAAGGEVPNLLGAELSIAETIGKIGARCVNALSPHVPAICIGDVDVSHATSFAVRAVFSGWRAGILPAQAELLFGFEDEFPLSGTLAAALALNEAFLFVRRGTPEAGLREIGVSLWKPDSVDDWWQSENDGPALAYLPSKLWLIGLGHLGQAYLWALSMLSYEAPENVLLVLQDIDTITRSTLSTSILSDEEMVGVKKTRAMAGAMEARGFSTAIIERRFDETLRVLPDDPQIALCGLDNALGRQPLCDVGFKLVVEAGLGRGAKDFRAIRIHTFPDTKDPRELWKTDESAAALVDARAYADLRARGVDQCGVTLLAGKAVGAPFVGMTAAAFSIAEILRFLHGGPVFAVHDIDLKAPQRRLSLKRKKELIPFNPGFSRSRD